MPQTAFQSPPRPLLALLVASLVMCVLTMGFVRDYWAGWQRNRMGKSIEEQRLSMGSRPSMPGGGVAWFDRGFVETVARLKRTVPEDARILVEPSSVLDRSGRARWYLYLNYFAHPLRFYVRLPAAASGTLVDYERWLDHHMRKTSAMDRLDEAVEFDERGIDWKLRFAVTRDFAKRELELYKRDGPQWVRVPLAALGPARGPKRAEDSAGDDAQADGDANSPENESGANGSGASENDASDAAGESAQSGEGSQ